MKPFPPHRRGALMYKLLASTILAVALSAPSSRASETSPAASASPSGHHLLAHFHHSKEPAGLPHKWDKRIPLPDGAMVKVVKPPAGAGQAVEFSTPGDLDHTVAFYKDALPKAGFALGPEIKVPARKAYSLNFMRAGVQDTLAIFPDKTDPSKLAMRIVYTPEKGWVRSKLAKWEDRARVLPKWWRHHEEEKKADKAPAAALAQP
jgi:hypothetical protein